MSIVTNYSFQIFPNSVTLTLSAHRWADPITEYFQNFARIGHTGLEPDLLLPDVGRRRSPPCPQHISGGRSRPTSSINAANNMGKNGRKFIFKIYICSTARKIGARGALFLHVFLNNSFRLPRLSISSVFLFNFSSPSQPPLIFHFPSCSPFTQVLYFLLNFQNLN